MKKNIILHNPQFDKKENIKVSNLIKTNYISSQSHEVIEFEKKIKIYTRNKYCFATINGTSALHLALASLDVQKDDEVIVPSLTFIATINSIRYVGANPIFFDNDKDFIINITEVIKFLKENTFTKNIKKTKYTFNKKIKKVIKAIIIVHPFGFATDISKLIKICKSKILKLLKM